MNKPNDQTRGIDSSGAFSRVGVDSSNETSKGDDKTSDKSDGDYPKGWSGLVGGVVKAVKDDFLTAVFVLVLVGYVIIETFGKDGINFREYIGFVVSLFILYKFLKPIDDFYLFIKKGVNFLNKKRYVLVIVLLLLIDTIFNHPNLVNKIVFIFKNLFK